MLEETAFYFSNPQRQLIKIENLFLKFTAFLDFNDGRQEIHTGILCAEIVSKLLRINRSRHQNHLNKLNKVSILFVSIRESS